MRRWLIRVTLLTMLVATAAVYWLFYDNRMPNRGVYPLDITALRHEAERIPGAKPERIELEIVSHNSEPRIAMIAGTT